MVVCNGLKNICESAEMESAVSKKVMTLFECMLKTDRDYNEKLTVQLAYHGTADVCWHTMASQGGVGSAFQVPSVMELAGRKERT